MPKVTTTTNIIELKQSLSSADIKIAKLTQRLEEARAENVKLRNRLNTESAPNPEKLRGSIKERDNQINTLHSVIESKNTFIKSQKNHASRIMPLAQAYLDLLSEELFVVDTDKKNQTLLQIINTLKPLAQIQVDYANKALLPKDYIPTIRPTSIDSPTKENSITTGSVPSEVVKNPVSLKDITKEKYGQHEAFSTSDSGMSQYLGKRLEITATFKRFSTVKLYNGKYIPVLLLHNIKLTDGTLIKDHSWMLAGNTLLNLNLKENERIRLQATVREYTRKDGSKAFGFTQPKLPVKL